MFGLDAPLILGIIACLLVVLVVLTIAFTVIWRYTGRNFIGFLSVLARGEGRDDGAPDFTPTPRPNLRTVRDRADFDTAVATHLTAPLPDPLQQPRAPHPPAPSPLHGEGGQLSAPPGFGDAPPNLPPLPSGAPLPNSSYGQPTLPGGGYGQPPAARGYTPGSGGDPLPGSGVRPSSPGYGEPPPSVVRGSVSPVPYEPLLPSTFEGATPDDILPAYTPRTERRPRHDLTNEQIFGMVDEDGGIDL